MDCLVVILLALLLGLGFVGWAVDARDQDAQEQAQQIRAAAEAERERAEEKTRRAIAQMLRESKQRVDEVVARDQAKQRSWWAEL
jgi:uncharacterized protein HemX